MGFAYFQHLFWLLPLTTEQQLCPPTALVVTDTLRHLSIKQSLRQTVL